MEIHKRSAEEIHEALHILYGVAREANVVTGDELTILPISFGEFILLADKVGITIEQLTKLFEQLVDTEVKGEDQKEEAQPPQRSAEEEKERSPRS